MSINVFETEKIESHGRTYRVEYIYDPDRGEPWKEDEGRGVVSEWTTRDPEPGERVLHADRHQRRYYDVNATLAKAIKDGWGADGGRRKGERAKAYAMRAVEDDFTFIQAWCRDEWHYCGVAVTLLDSYGATTNHAASLWGVETWKDYHRTVVKELIEEIEAEIVSTREKVAPRVDPNPDVNWMNDAIQFPRLLAEIDAVATLTDAQTCALAASMDLTRDQIEHLFWRATETWDAIKARTPGR